MAQGHGGLIEDVVVVPLPLVLASRAELQGRQLCRAWPWNCMVIVDYGIIIISVGPMYLGIVVCVGMTSINGFGGSKAQDQRMVMDLK